MKYNLNCAKHIKINKQITFDFYCIYSIAANQRNAIIQTTDFCQNSMDFGFYKNPQEFYIKLFLTLDPVAAFLNLTITKTKLVFQ